MVLALETVGRVKSFDGFVATKDLSLRVEAGARHALIGPNGASDAIMRHRVSFRDDRSGEG